jgi:hypothetical protein
VPLASTRPVQSVPLAHQVPVAQPVRRALSEYDQLCGVASVEVVG